MWSDLIRPWQVCFELAWEAYCDDCIPIGAVVTDAGGNVLTRGRNRIYEKNSRHGRLPGNEIAHAEVEALQALDYAKVDQHTCILYSTTEPCPMCMGTFYMSGVRTLHFAARDPYAGSINMLGTTWYLSRKPIKVYGPDPALESTIMSLFVEQELGFHAGKFLEGLFWEMYEMTIPEGISLGRRLYEQGELKTMRKSGMAARDVYDRLTLLVTDVTHRPAGLVKKRA
jgi:tRNA(adenine34) deaminase